MLHSNDPVSKFSITKPNAKKLLKYLFSEMKGFIYQIILKVSFRKEIENIAKKNKISITNLFLFYYSNSK